MTKMLVIEYVGARIILYGNFGLAVGLEQDSEVLE